MNNINIIEKITRIILFLRIPIIILFFLIFLCFGYFKNSLIYDNSAGIDDIIKEDDRVLQEYRKFEKDFESNDNIIIGLQAKNIFNNQFIYFLKDLNKELIDIEGVDDVIDLTTISDVYGQNNDLIIEKFILEDEMPYSDTQLNKMKEYFINHKLLKNRFVDTSGKATLVYIRYNSKLLTNDKTTEVFINQILNKANKLINDKKVSINCYFAGDKIVESVISDIQKKEEYISYIMMASLFIILFIIFRRINGALLPIIIAVISLVFTIGFKALLKSEFSTIDSLLYALIFTISIGDSVHILSAWYSADYNMINDKKQRITEIMKHIFRPCFFTSLTTAIGFGAISISTIPQLRNFGFFASISVIFAFIITMTLTPSVLVLFNFKKRKDYDLKQISFGKRLLNRLNDKITGFLKNITLKYSKIIILIFTVFLIISIIGIFFVKIGTNPYSFLKDNNKINIALRFIEENISGIKDVEVIIEKDGEEPFKDPEIIDEIDSFQSEIEKMDGVSVGNSYIILLKLMNQAMHGNDINYYSIPETKNLVGQYLLLYEMSDDEGELDKWINYDYNKIRINFKIKNSCNFKSIDKKIEEYFKKSNNSFKYYITGSAKLWDHTDRIFLKNQLMSLFLSIIVISIILFLLFKSFKFGIISFIVNIFPILAGLSILGFSGIGLNMGTVMIAPIIIGIAVDDTIHFLNSFKINKKKTDDLNIIYTNVFKSVTKPIVFTSVILAFGFGSNIISSFKPNAYFGAVSAVTLLIAMISDLLLLPSLISIFYKKNNK